MDLPAYNLDPVTCHYLCAMLEATTPQQDKACVEFTEVGTGSGTKDLQICCFKKEALLPTYTTGKINKQAYYSNS